MKKSGPTGTDFAVMATLQKALDSSADEALMGAAMGVAFVCSQQGIAFAKFAKRLGPAIEEMIKSLTDN